MTLDEAVTKENFLRKTGKFLKKGANHVKRNARLYTTIGLTTLASILNSCQPEDEPKPDQDYTITINAESELENKYIKDGTTAFFVETGNDTIFANTKNEKANIKVFASEGREIDGVVGIKENKGHYSAKQNVSLTGNEELLLEMNGKSNISTLNISTTYQTKGTATNIKLTINPGNVTATTNENGEANIEYENETNEYNEINTNASITAESTPTSNVQINTKNYTKTIDETIEEWNFELTKSEYEHNFNNTVKSSLTNKQIKDGTKVGIIINSNNTDTTWTDITNEAYITTIKSNLATENYQLIFKNIPGHQEKTVSGTSTGTTNKETTLTAKNYTAFIPIHLTKNDEDLAGILITGIGADKTTNNTGRETLIDENLETNTYNEPQTNYEKTATLTGNTIGTVTQKINYKEGNNEEQTYEITPQTLTNIINYITNVNSGTAWLVEKGTTDTTFVNIKSNGTATINYNHPYAEENVLVIGARSQGKIPQSREITAVSDNEYNETFDLEDKLTNYNITGKIINDKGDDRLKNIVNALRITRSNGEEIYASTDANGEFNKQIQTKPGEKLDISLNIPGQRERTLSIIYDPQKTTDQELEYPKNRLVETSWDLYAADSAFVTPEEISKLPITIIPLSEEMATNDTLKWMMEGTMTLRGSTLYVGDSPIRKYICTTDYENNNQMTQEEINKTKIATNKVEQMMNRPEIGPALPFENGFVITPTKISTVEELYNTINMTRGGTEYLNGMVYEEPQTEARMLGWSARGPSTINDTYVLEIGAPNSRDPPAESGLPTTAGHAYEFRGDTVYGLSDIGKVLMIWNHNAEPETGKMGVATKGDWDANTKDWKQDAYLAINNQIYNINKLESGLLTATNSNELISLRNKTKIFNEITKTAIDNKDYVTAQKFINKTLEQNTGNKEALLNQSIILEATGKKEEAIKLYQELQQTA